jgi:hypothetical protein
MKAGDRNAHLLTHKIARLVINGDVHAHGDDFVEYLQLSNALARCTEAGVAHDLISIQIDELMEESDG